MPLSHPYAPAPPYPVRPRCAGLHWLQQRLQWCQQQRAHFGMLLHSSIAIEIQEIERERAQIDTRLAETNR
jgi:hypothetical protein